MGSSKIDSVKKLYRVVVFPRGLDRMRNKLILFLVSWIFHCQVYGDIDITEIRDSQSDDYGFEIAFNGVKLMKHAPPDFPLFSLGLGSFTAEQNVGNWHLNDTISTKILLDEWDLDITETHYVVTMTSAIEGNEGLGLRFSLEKILGPVDGSGRLYMKFNYSGFDYTNVNRFFMNLPAGSDEAIFGGGEQYTHLNLRKLQRYPIWVREQGVGRNLSSPLTKLVNLDNKWSGGDYHTTYWPMASFMSSKKYHFELRMPTYSEMKFPPEGVSSRHEVYWHHNVKEGDDYHCEECQIVFSTGYTFKDVLRVIHPTNLPTIPEWVHDGAIIGVQGGTARMLDILGQMQREHTRVAGLWIQDWSGKITTNFGQRVFWNWKWNETRYPDLDNVIQRLKYYEGVRVTAYVTAHLNVLGDVYKNNSAENFWITTANGDAYIQDYGQFDVVSADILEPDPDCDCVNEAREFYKTLLKENLMNLGLAGWMADFGEYLPVDGRSQFPHQWWSKQDHGEILHQTFSQAWASVNFEAVAEAGKQDEVMFWMRSGGRKSQLGMSWAGDQTVDWTASDGIKSSIVAALSLAVSGSGVGLTHSDIGGYTSFPELGVVRSKELLLRWAEYSVFTPVMRTHETNHPDENHQVYTDTDTIRQFSRLSQIFHDTKDYRKAMIANNTHLEGVPLMRPLFVDFEDDPDAFDVQYQYMLGDDVLVAPVTEPDVSEWLVYLPKARVPEFTWIHLWTGNEFTGGQWVRVTAPLGNAPVFYRSSSTFKTLFEQVRQKYSNFSIFHF